MLKRLVKAPKLLPFLLLISLVPAICASRPLAISCRVIVPEEYRRAPPGWAAPDGEPEALRYRKGYEAFWWNCAILKGLDLDARCPCMCSGTPGTSAGCADGARDAERQIQKLIKEYGRERAQQLLRILSDDPEGAEKIEPYFPASCRDIPFQRGNGPPESGAE